MSRQALLSAGVLTAGLFVAASLSSGQSEKDEPPKPFQAKVSSTPTITLKRRNDASDEDLRKQLLAIPETGFGQGAAAVLYKPIKDNASTITNLQPDLGKAQFRLLTAQVRKPEQFFMPWRLEPDCSMGKEASERLHVLSLRLRDYLRKSVPKDDVRPDADKLKAMLLEGEKPDEWKKPQAIPTLTQMLQAENTPIRQLLVELLANIPGKDSSMALGQRAFFDLSPEVREKAVQALAARPAAEYQQLLLDGLRYPWPAAADHAAEALAALQLTPTVTSLVNLLKEPSPGIPFKQSDKVYQIREVVRVNHLSNCMLCHPPGLAKDDLVRGRIPMPGEDPPPLYYSAATGLFVRANTTYLRQDFSVVQPVEDNGKWPANQRFDYLMRTRPLNAVEIKLFQQLEKKGEVPTQYPQQESVLFALREITKEDAGSTYDSWSSALPKIVKKLKEQEKK